MRDATGRLASWVGILCNLILAVGKMTIGLISGSISVVADGLNNLMDTASSIIALLGFKFAAKKADKEHPFGHGRYEYISALAVAVLVLVVGIELGKSSFGKILSPTPVDFGPLSFSILIGSILLKLWLSAFNRNIGQSINSTVFKATAIDSRNDVIATSAVLLTAILSRFTGMNLDGWAGLGVAAFIIYNGISLVRETLNPLLGEAPEPELVKYITDKIAEHNSVIGTHDLIVHDYGYGRQFASIHVEISSDMDAAIAHRIIDGIERDFLINDNIHLIIHHDPVITSDKTRLWVENQVKEIDGRMSIHDLNIEKYPDHTDYFFDVYVPPEIEISEQELRSRIEELLKNGDKHVHAMITIDRSHIETLYKDIKGVKNGEKS